MQKEKKEAKAHAANPVSAPITSSTSHDLTDISDHALSVDNIIERSQDDKLVPYLIDSGCSYSYTGELSDLQNIKASSGTVVVANGGHAKVEKEGVLFVRVGNTPVPLRVLYIPNFKRLLSVSQLQSLGIHVEFPRDRPVCKLSIHSDTIDIPRLSGLYLLHVSLPINPDNNLLASPVVDESVLLKHAQLGHPGIALSKKMKIAPVSQDDCKPCREAKTVQRTFRANLSRAPSVHEVAHVDLASVNIPSLGGSKSFIPVYDDHSAHITLYFLKRKSDSKESLTDYRARFPIKQFHVDGAPELISLASNFALPGVEIYSRKPYCLQENPRAERIIQKLIVGARVLLLSSNLPSFLWTEAVAHFAWLSNHRFSFASKIIPVSVFYPDSQPIDWNQVLPFGTKVEFYLEQKQPKLASRLATGYFVGYADNKAVPHMVHYNGARIFNPDFNKVVVGRIIKTYWNEYFPQEQSENFNLNFTFNDDIAHDDDYHPAEDVDNEEIPRVVSPIVSEHILNNSEVSSEDDTYSSVSPANNASPQPRSAFGRIPGFYEGMAVHHGQDLTRKDILKSDKREQWLAAEQHELKQLQRKQVYDIIRINQVPKDEKILPVKFVYAEKPTKLKARLTACGNFAPTGIIDPYAPTVSTASIFIVLALSVLLGWKLNFYDVEAAYLEAILPFSAYCHLPPGYIVPNEFKNHRICWKLKKALYGLRESAQAWYKHAKSLLQDTGYECLPIDPGLYIHTSSLGVSILAVHVDDITAASSTQAMQRWVNKTLFRLFPLKDTSDNAEILGIQLKFHDKNLFLHMPRAVSNILKRFDLEDANPKATPMPLGYINDYSLPVEDSARSIIGSLSYFARLIRPDILFPLNYISRHPRLQASKRIVRYIKHTLSSGIYFPAGNENSVPEIIGYCDANYHRSGPQSSENTCGFLFFLRDKNSPSRIAKISAASKKLKCIADSTALAEIIGLHMAVKEAIFLKNILTSLGFPQRCVTIFCDSQSVVQFVNSGKISDRNKHWDVKYLMIHEYINKGEISVIHVPGDENPADMLTKALSASRLDYLKEKCNLVRDPDVAFEGACHVPPIGSAHK
jgi:hypothetical protein